VQVVALGYFAPPGGLFHLAMMRLLTHRVAKIVAQLGVKPDLVMAHKLTIEGVVAHALWQRSGIPYACSIRGEVEEKFLRYKPALARHVGDVVREAESLYFVSAWFEKAIARRYPGLVRRQARLPNFVSDAISPAFVPWNPDVLLTVLDLGMYRRKGFPELVAGLAWARRTNPKLRLDVVGWSTPRVMREVRRMVRRAGVADAVNFLGVMKHDEVLARMPRYAALVLPAKNETFGMVYAEALLSGVPILYAQDSGIDGYVDDIEVGVRVPQGDFLGVAEGLLALSTDSPKYRRVIRESYDVLRARFDPEPCLADFRVMLGRACRRVRRLAIAQIAPVPSTAYMEGQHAIARNLRTGMGTQRASQSALGGSFRSR
jgi:glycosyltransferase involved in cell wall biosynthesis